VIEIPAPGLDPERFLTFELELDARSHSGPISLNGALFCTRISDLIVRQPTGELINGGSTVRKRNAADSHVWGFELESSVQTHRHWRMFAKAAWNEATTQSGKHFLIKGQTLYTPSLIRREP